MNFPTQCAFAYGSFVTLKKHYPATMFSNYLIFLRGKKSLQFFSRRPIHTWNFQQFLKRGRFYFLNGAKFSK